jgi:hypothetical protein
VTTSPDCRFLEDRGLLVEQQGVNVDQHLASCPTCRENRRRIAALETALGQIPLPAPAGHWEQAVWSKLAARQASRPARWWGGHRPLAVASAAVVLGLSIGAGVWFVQDEGGADAPVHLAMRFERGAERTRGEGQATVGDTMVVEVSGLVAVTAELRIYRDDAGLALRCSAEPPCQRQGDRLLARWRVPAPGRYRILVATGAGPFPAPSGSYDEDASALQAAAGGATHLERSLEVW